MKFSLNRVFGVCTALVFMVSTGCSTTLRVNKVPEKETLAEAEPGLRYSLPATFLAVEPDPEKRGGFTIEPLLVPDHQETYAINARTFLQGFTFNVELEDGLLKKVVLKQDSGELAAEAVGAASEILKGELDKKAEEKKEAEEAAKAEAQKLQGLQQAVADAELEQQLAGEEVTQWERIKRELEEPDLDVEQGLLKARLRLRKAEIELQRAQEALAAARDTADSTQESLDAIQDKADQGTGADDKNSQFPTVKGPVYYRLVDTCDPWNPAADCTVKLEPVDWKPEDGIQYQRDFHVSAVPPPPPPPPSPKPKLKDTQVTPEPAKFEDGQLRRVLTFTRPICEVLEDESMLEKVSSGEELPLDTIGLLLLGGGSKVELQIKENVLSPGEEYRLELHFTYGNCEKPEDDAAPVVFRVRT